MTDPLDVLVVTVDESYYIPRFLASVVEADDVNIVGVTTMPPSLGTQNIVAFAWDLFRSFGPFVFGKHVAFYGKYTALDLFNRYLGRGSAYSPKTLARRHGIQHRHVTDVNTDSFVEYARSLNPDIVASIAATQRFEAPLLSVPQRCAINIHSSLLPAYRGVSPSFWSLLNDEDRTGVTVHYMDEEIDTGDVVLQESLLIRDDDTLHTLNERVADRGSEVLLEALRRIATDSVDPTPIDPKAGSYYSVPEREDVREFRHRGNRFF